MIRRSSATSSGESGVPSEPSSARRVGGGGGVEGERHQHGALALDQVVAGGLAGRGRVAEDAEQVVAQLERLAEREAERRQRLQRRRARRRRARRRCAAGARWSTSPTCSAAPSSRCRRRRGRAPAPTRRGTDRRSPRSGTGRRPRARARPGPRQPAAAQQLVGPAQQQVAEQDRGGGAVLLRVAAPPVAAVLGLEGAVRRRPAAAGVGGVHEVVVDQRAGVQELERRAGADQGVLVGRPSGATARWPQ